MSCQGVTDDMLVFLSPPLCQKTIYNLLLIGLGRWILAASSLLEPSPAFSHKLI